MRALHHGKTPDRRQLFVLSHALAQPVKALGGKSLLEHPAGGGLVDYWAEEAKRKQLLPFHWRGLFRSYMQAPESPLTERLSKLLAGSIDGLKTGPVAPIWMEGLRRHVGVLGAEPCVPYAKDLLAEESHLLDDLKQHVEIPAHSWFWSELRTAAACQIAALTDAGFKPRLQLLLSLTSRLPGGRDAVLAATVDRYARCVDRSRNAQLIEFAIEAWGSPQLRSNRSWSLVAEGARQMVCGWLAQEDLEDFYRICRGTGQIDERRLRFWLRFKEQMGYTQILLGGQIRSSRDPEMREFLLKKKGRVGELTSGPASNNAILMQIGSWLFIEFSETGNACYAYPVADAAIELGRRSYSLSQLKSPAKSLRRLEHRDRSADTWEATFQAELRQVGVLPDSGASTIDAREGAKRVVSTATNPSSTGRSSRAVRHPGDAVTSRLAEQGIRFIDFRAKGGTVWAYPDTAKQKETVRWLGMKFKAEKGGFFLP